MSCVRNHITVLSFACFHCLHFPITRYQLLIAGVLAALFSAMPVQVSCPSYSRFLVSFCWISKRSLPLLHYLSLVMWVANIFLSLWGLAFTLSAASPDERKPLLFSVYLLGCARARLWRRRPSVLAARRQTFRGRFPAAAGRLSLCGQFLCFATPGSRRFLFNVTF